MYVVPVKIPISRNDILQAWIVVTFEWHSIDQKAFGWIWVNQMGFVSVVLRDVLLVDLTLVIRTYQMDFAELWATTIIYSEAQHEVRIRDCCMTVECIIIAIRWSIIGYFHYQVFEGFSGPARPFIIPLLEHMMNPIIALQLDGKYYGDWWTRGELSQNIGKLARDYGW